ncbi:DNA-directed RNA polymerase subunit beta [Candidatus Poribacteria bacterium]|nr:DNA-directed RNA polymerase subunit beta [Candidatus Poribacteria bacterium]
MYHDERYGKRVRRSYAKIPAVMELPDLIEIQKKSYAEFLQKDVSPEERSNIGLQAAFLEVFPVTDYSDTLTLEFVSYSLGEPKYDVQECQERGMTYAAPLKVKVRLIVQEKDKETGFKREVDIREQDVYMGELPLMTDTGTFIINGAERVIVSQLHRSPGVIYADEVHSSGRRLFSSRIIPYRGAWIEFEYDTSDVIHVRLDHRKKMPATLLLRALGWVTDEEIMRVFARVERVEVPLWGLSEETISIEDIDNYTGRGLINDVKLEGSDQVVVRSDEILIDSVIERVKTSNAEQIDITSEQFPSSLIGRITASPVIDTTTGEVLANSNEELTFEILNDIRDSKLTTLELLDQDETIESLKLSFWDRKELVLERGSIHKGLNHIISKDIVDEDTGDVLAKAGDLLDTNVIAKIDETDVNQVSVYKGELPVELAGKIIASPVIDTKTGEIIAEKDEEVTIEILKRIYDVDTQKNLSLELLNAEDAEYTNAIRNTLDKDEVETQDDAMVEIFRRLQPGDPPTIDSARSRVEKLFFDPKRYDLFPVGRYKLNRKLGLDVPLEQRTLRREDIVETLKYLMKVEHNVGDIDDIDHLGNRRVRPVGELLQVQFRNGLSRVERAVRERMTVQNSDEIMPHDLINSKPLTGAIKDFFGSSQLSQFMQQINPLDELTHKRRLSALGPGGLHRDRATFEVRDVHHTHYGRLCPIETPEGPSVGLIVSLSTYARVNEYGFLETPYRKVANGIATDEIEYLSADQEDPLTVAQANAPVDEAGRLEGAEVLARYGDDFPRVMPEEVDYMDVSPNQVVSVSAALIPFLEHDDANRALMGSNMQRQGVPLINPRSPYIGTGTEYKAAVDSGAVLVAKRAGVVESVSANEIIIRADDASMEESDQPFRMGYDIYRLIKFKRSNNGTCINQRPIVRIGEKIARGQVIADGPSTELGEMALGSNVLTAFMPWGGYNFEDAIIISENLVKDDTFTSIHIEEFELEARDTKLGREEFTRDIPNVGEDALRDLDEDGIIREGSRIEQGDILIGRVTPKGESELRPEEKLLRAIFGEKAGDVRDASLTARPGVEGTVVNVNVFSRREKEKDKQTQLRESSQIKAIEKKYAAQVDFINEKKNEEVKRLLLGSTLASSLSKGDDIIARRGDEVTRELLEKVDSLDGFFVQEEQTNLKIQRIRRLADGRIEELKLERDGKIEKIQKGDELRPGVIKLAKVYIANKRKISVGDKLSGRHGNKGVIAKILPVEDMPYLQDGTPIDIILNPLGVPSRMNVGQILEAHLGWAAEKLGIHVATPVFDGATEEEIKDALEEAGLPRSGQVTLYDGRTGEPFDRKVTVGYSYMMKLIHLVEDKLHARSIGPYSLVTQQPLGGKAQFGGQRFGEMEVWALEAYGAAHLLQEILTVKSDDVAGRTKIYESIVKGENAPEPGTPESFNVLVKELQSLCIDVSLEQSDSEDEEVSSSQENEIEAKLTAGGED